MRGKLHGEAALTWIHAENEARCPFVGEKNLLSQMKIKLQRNEHLWQIYRVLDQFQVQSNIQEFQRILMRKTEREDVF